MNLRRKRVQALVNAWSKIIREGAVSRDRAAEILKKCYEELKIEPIRGVSLSPDLYDKDLISLYIIGKLGLGIEKEFGKDNIKKLFYIETKIEHIVNKFKNVSSYEELCKEDAELCSGLDDKFVARILRYIFTMYYFGFIDRETFVELIRKSYTILKPMEETVRRFAKFVIAYEVGRKAIESEIRTKMELNMVKNTIALDLGIPNALPSTGYIIDVAKYFFNLPRDFINNLKS